MTTLILGLVIVDSHACEVPDHRLENCSWVNDHIDEHLRGSFWEIPPALRRMLGYQIIGQTFDDQGECQSGECFSSFCTVDSYLSGESDSLPVFRFSQEVRSVVKSAVTRGRKGSTKWISFGRSKKYSAATLTFDFLAQALALKDDARKNLFPVDLRYLPPTHTIFAQQYCIAPEYRANLLSSAKSGLLLNLKNLMKSESLHNQESEDLRVMAQVFSKWFDYSADDAGHKQHNRHLGLDYFAMTIAAGSFGILGR